MKNYLETNTESGEANVLNLKELTIKMKSALIKK